MQFMLALDVLLIISFNKKMNNFINKKFWKNKKVFVTGHTGFKGSWLSYLLDKHGAKVKGFLLKTKVYT